MRFKTGFKSSKTVRWADMRRERIPVTRWRYRKCLRGSGIAGTALHHVPVPLPSTLLRECR